MTADIADLIVQARRLVADRLGEQAAAHCERVAASAQSIARAYGADPAEAFLGGLLHDWAKQLSDDELLDAAGRYGIPVGGVERTVPYLLHAAVGAAQVAEALPAVPADVVRAIERHTVGAPGMSVLDMAIFLADMIEPARDYPGVEDLREGVGVVPLPRLYIEGYARSLGHVIEKRHHLHPATVPAWNAAIDAAEATGR